MKAIVLFRFEGSIAPKCTILDFLEAKNLKPDFLRVFQEKTSSQRRKQKWELNLRK